MVTKLRTPPASGSGITSNALFRAACSCTITAVDPNTTATAPSVRATRLPSLSARTCSIMVAICSAPWGPMSCRTSSFTADDACSGVTTRPTSTITMTSSGASENTV
ncbi:MAG: hypothetical protein R3F59_33195 [Myxococcota bacterium]